MSRPDDAHDCPWPGCKGWAKPMFWGCPTHWAMLPTETQRNWIRCEHDPSMRAVQAESIQQYIRRLHSSLDPLPAAPTATEPVDSKSAEVGPTFTCGRTVHGDVFMFWPRDRQYVLLTADEVDVLRGLVA